MRPAEKTPPERKIAMRHFGGLVAVFTVIAASCGATLVGDSWPKAQRSRFTETREVQGIPCAKGYVWFYANGKLRQCAVSKEFVYGEANLPARSLVVLLPNGRPKYAMLQHNSVIAGVKCSGGNWLLGPSEGAMTAFYPSGKLKQCFLSEDEVVQEVPCRAGSFFRGGTGVTLYEDGKLESCTLAKGFRTQRSGDRFTQVP
jgi:antitoxin component YwqK of YwqJK toxin-antitoxin module